MINMRFLFCIYIAIFIPPTYPKPPPPQKKKTKNKSNILNWSNALTASPLTVSFSLLKNYTLCLNLAVNFFTDCTWNILQCFCYFSYLYLCTFHTILYCKIYFHTAVYCKIYHLVLWFLFTGSIVARIETNCKGCEATESCPSGQYCYFSYACAIQICQPL
jgi:hypothetical protein